MTAFQNRYIFSILTLFFLVFALSATEYLNQNLNWIIYQSHCKGKLEKIATGYRVSKAPSPDVNSDYECIYFHNVQNIACKPGLHYRVTMKLAACDATITPKMIVNFPTRAKRTPGQYRAEFKDGIASVDFQAQKEDSIRVNLWLGRGDGAVVVDSIQVDPVSNDSSSTKENKKGNLLGQGSGFEVGPRNYNAYAIANWWWGWTDLMTWPVRDDKVAHDGKYSLRFTSEKISGQELMDPCNHVWFYPVKLDPNKTYTVSAWVKASNPGIIGVLSSNERGKGYRVERELPTEWERISLTFKPEDFKVENHHRVFFSIKHHSSAAGSVWFDSAQLEEGDTATAYQAEPLEFGAVLETPKDDKLLKKSALKDAAFTLRFRNNTSKDVQRKIRYVIKDYWNRACASGEISASVPADANRTVTAAVPTLKCGYYRAEFGDGRDLYDEVVFGVYEPMKYAGKLPKDWPLGCHDSSGMQILRDLGFGWVRMFHDFRMVEANPQKGVFNFKNIDKAVALCENANLNIMPVLGPALESGGGFYGHIPAWAIEKKQKSAIPGSWINPVSHPSQNAWGDYVRAVTARYKGRIDTWEIFNEPDCWITPDEYLVYLQTAYKAAKSVNPNSVIVAGSTTSDFGKRPLPWTRAFMEKDGYKSFDAISVHMYGTAMPERNMGGADNYLVYLRNLLKSNGRDIPVMHTEKSYAASKLGYSCRKFDLPSSYHTTPGFKVKDLQEKAEWMLRETILDSCAGKGPFFWFGETNAWNSLAPRVISGFDPYWLYHVEFDGSPLPEMLAANGLARMIEGRSTPMEMVKISMDSYVGIYSGADGAVAAIWNIRGKFRIELPAAGDKCKLYDFFGEPLEWQNRIITLTPTPVYLRADGMTAETLRDIILSATCLDAPVSISGGIEMRDSKPMLAVYLANGGVGGRKLNCKVSKLPEGWALKKDSWSGISQKTQDTCVVFPVSKLKASGKPQTFEFVINDSESRSISIPGIASQEEMIDVIRENRRAVAVRSASPKKIDGILNDWLRTPLTGTWISSQVKIGRHRWLDPVDLSCDARFEYDDENLYASFVVHDNVVERFAPPAGAYLSDSIEFFLGLDPNDQAHKNVDVNAYGKSDYQIFLAPGMEGGDYPKATAAIAGQNRCSYVIASTLTADGYILEVALPWKSLKPGFVPSKGTELLMSFQVTDTDVPGQPSQKKIFWMGDESNYKAPSNWGRLILE